MKHLHIHIDRYEIQWEVILRNISRIVNANDRIAVVWPNGAGKTTFLRILSGEIQDYTGQVENIWAIRLGYLEQIHFMDESKTVREDLRDAFTELRALERTIEEEEKKLEETGEYEAYTEALERYKLLGWYTYENELERVARGIGIFHLLEHTLSGVSGGERTKIALVKILLSRPDFLLLDEPTNFIDLSSVEWLEKYLTESWKWGYMIISHDRAFLDETCVETIEILGDRGMREYAGNYSFSVEEKEKNYEIALKKYEEQETMVASEKSLINRFRAGSRASFAKSREKALDRIEKLDKPAPPSTISFYFESAEWSADLVLNCEDVFIWRQDPLFYIREISLHRGERIWLIGENGAGKSTFLKTILHHIPVLEGTIKYGKWLEISYYSQLHEELDLEKNIYDNFHKHWLLYTRERIANIIGNYGFSYHDIDTPMSMLSGGERSKILFSILGQKPSNFLILDEPTNHLDYDSREALELALRKYEWTVLFISHDRYFVNKLATKIWVIDQWELSVSYGNYDDYQYKKDRGIDMDMSLFDADGEMSLVLEEKLGREEARRIKEKFARKKVRGRK